MHLFYCMATMAMYLPLSLPLPLRLSGHSLSVEGCFDSH